MQIIYEQKLKDYMDKKGFCAIVIESYAGQSWTGRPEISARFADQRLSKSLKEHRKVVRIIPGEAGELLILSPALIYEDIIRLRLKSFLGIKVVEVEGLRP